MPFAAVTFDFWNTLIREDGQARSSRVDAWLGVLEGEALAVEREQIEAALASGWQEFQVRWRENVQHDAGDAVDHAMAHLGLDPPPAIRTALAEAITDPPRANDPKPTENIEACLRALRAAGVRIGIICDVGLTPSRTLRRYLEAHGLLGYFDHWSFSDEVGVFKPDPAIFHHAMAGLGVPDPARCAHVGDLRRTDVAGANALGITSVRYTGVFDDPGDPEDGVPAEADHVLADHADLPAALGIG